MCINETLLDVGQLDLEMSDFLEETKVRRDLVRSLAQYINILLESMIFN